MVTYSFPLSHLSTSPKRGAAEITRVCGVPKPLQRKIRAVLEEGKADVTRTRQISIKDPADARERGRKHFPHFDSNLSAVNHNTTRFLLMAGVRT